MLIIKEQIEFGEANLRAWNLGQIADASRIVAHVLAGRVSHAMKIIGGDVRQGNLYPAATIDRAVAKINLSHLPATDNKRIHRDGWLFQMLSWIASVEEFPDYLIQFPHPRTANKGFDGLIIKLENGAVESVMICEDKATANPRSTVTDDIWPTFVEIERGDKDEELTSESEALLSQSDALDIEAMTRSSQWFNDKQYRASVATSLDALPPVAGLFDGFSVKVAGEDRTRHANQLVSENVRDFLEAFTVSVIAELNNLREP